MRRAAAGVLAALALAAPAQAQRVTFDEVAPIFAARCVLCHAGAAAPLGLRLDTLEAVLAGGKNGPMVTATPAVAATSSCAAACSATAA